MRYIIFSAILLLLASCTYPKCTVTPTKEIVHTGAIVSSTQVISETQSHWVWGGMGGALIGWLLGGKKWMVAGAWIWALAWWLSTSNSTRNIFNITTSNWQTFICDGGRCEWVDGTRLTLEWTNLVNVDYVRTCVDVNW